MQQVLDFFKIIVPTNKNWENFVLGCSSFFSCFLYCTQNQVPQKITKTNLHAIEIFCTFVIDLLILLKMVLIAGADLRFSQGGRGDLFFRSTNLIFRALLKALNRRCFGPIFCAADKFLKNRSKKPFLVTFKKNFWKVLTKKIAARASPQSEYILAPNAPLEKF